MKNQIQIKIDMSIKPENCEEKGYKWWIDRYYDPEADEEWNKEFIELMEVSGVLGEAASQTMGWGWYGVYYPKEENK